MIESPPPILQIHREALKPGCEDAYCAAEEEITRIGLTLICPHPYLGIESLSGPKEAWFFNGFESRGDQDLVDDAYRQNKPLMAALTKASTRKAAFTLNPGSVFARYRPDATLGEPWLLGRGRFLVIGVGQAMQSSAGTVFVTDNDVRFVIVSAGTCGEADAIARSRGTAFRVFTVRPTWSTPAQAWIDADPEFWASYPPR
jgi:hypothetical protein